MPFKNCVKEPLCVIDHNSSCLTCSKYFWRSAKKNLGGYGAKKGFSITSGHVIAIHHQHERERKTIKHAIAIVCGWQWQQQGQKSVSESHLCSLLEAILKWHFAVLRKTAHCLLNPAICYTAIYQRVHSWWMNEGHGKEIEREKKTESIQYMLDFSCLSQCIHLML